MPMSRAVSWSRLVARMALPIRVRVTYSCMATIMMMVTTRIRIWCGVMLTPPSEMELSTNGLGKRRRWVPHSQAAVFDRMNETPIAESSGARRVALRSGL